MTQPRFTWGNSVQVKPEAPQHLRAGDSGEVVAITEVNSAYKAQHYGVPLGSTVYQVEFGDGEAIEIPDSLVTVDPDL